MRQFLFPALQRTGVDLCCRLHHLLRQQKTRTLFLSLVWAGHTDGGKITPLLPQIKSFAEYKTTESMICQGLVLTMQVPRFQSADTSLTVLREEAPEEEGPQGNDEAHDGWLRTIQNTDEAGAVPQRQQSHEAWITTNPDKAGAAPELAHAVAGRCNWTWMGHGFLLR